MSTFVMYLYGWMPFYFEARHFLICWIDYRLVSSISSDTSSENNQLPSIRFSYKQPVHFQIRRQRPEVKLNWPLTLTRLKILLWLNCQVAEIQETKAGSRRKWGWFTAETPAPRPTVTMWLQRSPRQSLAIFIVSVSTRFPKGMTAK